MTSYLRDSLGRPTSVTRGTGTPEATTTSITYHATWNVPIEIVEPGLTTTLTWNAAGRLSQVIQTDTTSHTVPYPTNGLFRSWTYTYGPGGVLMSANGPAAGSGDTVNYTYTNGYLETVTNEMGHVTTVTARNGRGQPTSVTGPNGEVTSYGYDGLGRVTSIIVNPGASQRAWAMTYTAAGDVNTLQEPTGATYTFTWDSARRLTKITDNLAQTVTMTRDEMGNLRTRIVQAADGTTITYRETNGYDELGRLLTQVGGEGRTWRFGYDLTDNLVSARDPRLKTIGYAYDAVSRLITETERDAGVVTRTYNGKDEEVSYQDPRSLQTTYVRNGFGEVIQETSPDRGTTVYRYDPRGMVNWKRDGRNIVSTYTFDNAGRLLTRSYPDTALNETFTYDATAGGNGGVGRLTSSTDAAGASDYLWDGPQQRQLSETRTFNAVSRTVSYVYDSAGRVSELVYPSGRRVLYGYDALGRIVSVSWKRNASAAAEPIASLIAYYPFGALTSMSLANGLNFSLTRDLEGRPNRLLLAPAGGGTALIDRLHPIGDSLNLTGLDNSAVAPSESQTFTYDNAGRMLTGAGPYGSLTWTYDKTGNRTSETRVAGGTTTVRSYAYPATSNLLASITVAGTAVRTFTYDAAGSLTGDATAGDLPLSFTINDASRIAQILRSASPRGTYLYDGRNRLARRQIQNMAPAGTTYYLYDNEDRLLSEVNQNGTPLREYIWVGDRPVAVVDGVPAAPTLSWVHADHLNRPELMTDGTGTMIWKAIYEPFGAVQSIIGTAANNQRFPGQWFQLEAGLHYNWWRHYDPSTGRYTQADPLSVVTPSVGPNLYAYVLNSPLENTDPSGLAMARDPETGQPYLPGKIPNMAGGAGNPKPPSPPPYTPSMPKPPGIPSNWTCKPAKKGGGDIYTNPTSPDEWIRVMPGNPSSPYPNSQSPYLRWHYQGSYRDALGRPGPSNSPDTHIPLGSFNYPR